jgi:hypothetical protein
MPVNEHISSFRKERDNDETSGVEGKTSDGSAV